MSPFVIQHPPGYSAERKYALEIAFDKYFGVAYRSEETKRSDVCITLPQAGLAKSLTVSDVLFQAPFNKWLRLESVPKEPLPWWNIPKELIKSGNGPASIPILYGLPVGNSYYQAQPVDNHYLGIDVFGALFFMLSRYEEAVHTARDEHDRFPASASLAYREGFLERPIINEYLDLLWAVLERLWPHIRRKRTTNPRILLSHDVDWPSSTRSVSTARILKSCVGDVVRRHDGVAAFRRLSSYAIGGEAGWRLDPYNTFDFLMDQSERAGLRSEFYFIPATNTGDIDGNCDLDSAEIRRLIRLIHERGHGIGYHASYRTVCDATRTRREFNKLKRVLREEGASQESWHGRQHYLRWQVPHTWQNWQEAGLDCDSSVGFADRVGFRCGYCHEFPVFNLASRQRLDLVERPLIAMDQTLTNYMGLTWPQIVEKMSELWRTCQCYGGDFTLLWHNSSLVTKRSQRWYREILRNLTSSNIISAAA